MSSEIKENSKVLHINAYFELPSDFEGTREEAVELFARYYVSKPVKVEFPIDRSNVSSTWCRFLERSEGSKLFGEFGVSEWTGENWKLVGRNANIEVSVEGAK